MTGGCTLSPTAIDPAALLAEVQAASGAAAGGLVTFTGLVRDEGGAVEALVLEAYRGMTFASIEAIARNAKARFDLKELRIVHRTGRVAVGEPVVFVAAAAAHRRTAFEAASYCMDRLKTEAVLWKREEGPGGARWIEPGEGDHADAARWQA